MDQDSCHCVFCTCGHHTGADPRSHPFLSVPCGTPPWTPDPAGAHAAGLYLCSVPAGAFAAALHHAVVLHIQLPVQEWKHISQEEEDVIYHQTASNSSRFWR